MELDVSAITGAAHGERSPPDTRLSPAQEQRSYTTPGDTTIECFFNRLKRFRRIARRCEKTIPAFMGFVHLACAIIWLR